MAGASFRFILYLPHQLAAGGINIIPTSMDVTARYRFMIWVIITTKITTTAGFTLASHSGFADPLRLRPKPGQRSGAQK